MLVFRKSKAGLHNIFFNQYWYHLNTAEVYAITLTEPVNALCIAHRSVREKKGNLSANLDLSVEPL